MKIVNYKARCMFIILATVSFWNSNASATTRDVACSGTITSALQTAVNSSVDGDIINIGAGTCSGGTVSWTNKNITVQGQGIGATTVSGLSFNVTDTAKAAFRITGMSVGAPSAWSIASTNTNPVKGWRVDHIDWSYPSCGQNISIYVTGINWGLIDHSKFTNAGNAIYLQSYVDGSNEVKPWPPSGKPGMGGNSALLPLNLGTDEAVYVEDSTFELKSNGCLYGIGDMYAGGRMVFRHNSVTNAYWQNHAARGYDRGGSLKAEIYNNDFNATDPAWGRAMHIRSGTGVVFNNTLRGYFKTINVDDQRSCGDSIAAPYSACDGSSAWDGNVSGESGWPCLDQIGRGTGQYPNQPSVPLYFWNNGSSTGCATGTTCNNSASIGQSSCKSTHVRGSGTGDSPHAGGIYDYVLNGTAPKPGYTPYTYPHPLQGGVSAPPPPSSTIAPPTTLRVQP